MTDGWGELDRKLRELEHIDAVSGVEKAISLVQEAAKENCPANDGELRSSIFTKVEKSGGETTGICYPNKKYGVFVEYGTGPKGQMHHQGISPNATPHYVQEPWWIHESQIGRETAEKYHWFHIDTPDGRFYQCSGQAAQPFLYPALKNNEEKVKDILREEIEQEIGRIIG